MESASSLGEVIPQSPRGSHVAPLIVLELHAGLCSGVESSSSAADSVRLIDRTARRRTYEYRSSAGFDAAQIRSSNGPGGTRRDAGSADREHAAAAAAPGRRRVSARDTLHARSASSRSRLPRRAGGEMTTPARHRSALPARGHPRCPPPGRAGSQARQRHGRVAHEDGCGATRHHLAIVLMSRSSRSASRRRSAPVHSSLWRTRHLVL